jgi:Domain of unknown function (DUF4384)
MTRRIITAMLATTIAIAGAPRHAAATQLAVDVMLDQGDAAVYQPGQSLGIKAHTSADGFLLVYEIDSQGYVNLLYPIAGRSGFVDSRNDLQIPPEGSQLDLVAQEPTGEGYVVALVSREPFKDLPWYLRPFDAQAEGAGYQGDTPPEEQGVTSDGRIVGDPFVAMERIRRRVLTDPDDQESFATSYTTFYVHEQVKYPRYLCDDCHRPSQWTWWPDYDPYYATCTAFTFRVNWGWYWGPAYWTGYVPYWVYVPAPTCPPGVVTPGITYSSWLGWNKWNAMWGGRLVRHETTPPAAYVGPSHFSGVGRVAGVQGRMVPPGFVTAGVRGGMTRGSRGTVYGRFTGTSPGGMMTTRDARGGLRPLSGAGGGDNVQRPDLASGRGGVRPITRGTGTPSGSPTFRYPQRGGSPGGITRFDPPQRTSTPGSFSAPPRIQRGASPQGVRPGGGGGRSGGHATGGGRMNGGGAHR